MLTDAVGVAIAFAIAVVTVPVGVSGAVFLVPVQISLLSVASPAVTPTNLLYNVIAVPGALWRYRAAEAFSGRLPRAMLLGTIPGVLGGALVRVKVTPGLDVFHVLVAAVLGPVGAWLLLQQPGRQPEAPRFGLRAVTGLAAVTGFIGGIYGIGGGSILGPALVAAGYSLETVAGSALAATLLTSMAGVAAFAALGVTTDAAADPVWHLGVLLGIGGLAGGYVGAHLQPRVPATLLKRGLGSLALLLALSYLLAAL